MPICERCGKIVERVSERYRFEIDVLDETFERLESEYLALPQATRDSEMIRRHGIQVYNDLGFYSQLKNTTRRSVECDDCALIPSHQCV